MKVSGSSARHYGSTRRMLTYGGVCGAHEFEQLKPRNEEMAGSID